MVPVDRVGFLPHPERLTIPRRVGQVVTPSGGGAEKLQVARYQGAAA